MVEIAKKSTVRLFVVLLFVMLTLSGLAFSLYLIYYGAHDAYTYLLAGLFIVLSLVSGFFNIFIAYSYYRSSFYNEYLEGIKRYLKPISVYPSVAIVMPVYNEEVGTVKRNMLRLMELKYPKEKLKFYLLDDSNIPQIRDGLKKFAKSKGIAYLHRDERKGFKAGALNNMLIHSKEDFVALFDYDEYLTNQNFLVDLLMIPHEPANIAVLFRALEGCTNLKKNASNRSTVSEKKDPLKYLFSVCMYESLLSAK